jgi:hypothetical protein
LARLGVLDSQPIKPPSAQTCKHVHGAHFLDIVYFLSPRVQTTTIVLFASYKILSD